MLTYIIVISYFNTIILACNPCKCDEGYNSWDLKLISCNNVSGLINIPNTIDDDVEELEFSGQSITILSDDYFSSLTKLVTINLDSNEIAEINKNAFRNLTSLKYLDLWWNKITELPTEVFSNTPNLTFLGLGANKITKLQTNLFSNLENLIGIFLPHNYISVIEENCFINVTSLEIINLQYNKLKYLNPNVFFGTNNLTELSLSSNPWKCDQSLCEMIFFFLELNQTAVPVCFLPKNYFNKSWMFVSEETCSHDKNSTDMET